MSERKPIDLLTIRGFRSIQDQGPLKLGKLNVLIGANGAGKSNFVALFQMLSELVEGRLQSWTRHQGSADRIVSFGVKETPQISATFEFGLNGYHFTLEPTVDGGFTFAGEWTLFRGRDDKADSLGSGHLEAKLKRLAAKGGNIASHCYKAIASWKVYHFHDTSETAGVKRLGALHDNDYLRPDASNLAAFLFRIANEQPGVYEQIRKSVRLAIPFFDDFVLKPQKLATEEEQIRLLWRQVDSDYPFWPSQLSDGSIRFICLVTALLQPNPPTTIIIDEPELGLHPYALTLLGALIRSASERMQVIVSTQSVPLVNEFSIDDLLVVERDNNATVFKRHSADDFASWLEDYSVGELWEKNVLGGRPPR